MATTSKDDALARAVNRLADVHDAQLGSIAGALKLVAQELRKLGYGNANTDMGAIEHLALKIKESADVVASALDR